MTSEIANNAKTRFLLVYVTLYLNLACRLSVTMVSSGAQTSSNELSDCMAQGLCRPIREPAPVTSFLGSAKPSVLSLLKDFPIYYYY